MSSESESSLSCCVNVLSGNLPGAVHVSLEDEQGWDHGSNFGAHGSNFATL